MQIIFSEFIKLYDSLHGRNVWILEYDTEWRVHKAYINRNGIWKLIRLWEEGRCFTITELDKAMAECNRRNERKNSKWSN